MRWWPCLILLAACTDMPGGLDLEAMKPDVGPYDAELFDGAEPADTAPPDAEDPDAGASDSLLVDVGSDDADVEDLGTRDAGETTLCTIAAVEGPCTEPDACGATAFYGRCPRSSASVCCLAAPPCSVLGATGVCVDTSICMGVSTPGLCPGAANVQCCTRPKEACDESAAPTLTPDRFEVTYDAACPPGMVLAGTACIDKFEAALVDANGAPWSPFVNPGSTPVRAVSTQFVIPQGYISADQADAACLAAGKRLCTDVEWLSACRGASDRTYPYGDVRANGRCNDARAVHPAVEYFGTNDPSVFTMLDHRCINQLPASITLTGERAGCESEAGAFDLMGNLHEWTADPSGTFRGGFYADTRINGEGCSYRTTAHARSYWDYSTGFRCCADPL